MALKSIKAGRLYRMLPKCFINHFKYEPLWLGENNDSEAAFSDGSSSKSKADDLIYGRLRTFLARVFGGKQDKMFEACHWALGSHASRIIELFARILGLNLGQLAFRKLWVCLSNEKRDEFAKIVYLMSEPRFCQFKKLLFNLPNSKHQTFVDKLERASYRQLNCYIMLLSTIDRPNPVNNFEIKNSGWHARPTANRTSMHPEAIKDDDWHELQQRILSLPTEIRNMIESSLWDVAFQPGKIFPRALRQIAWRNFARKVHQDEISYHLPVPRLFPLNKEMYAQMRTKYWSGNTWVIGYGSAGSTLVFLDHVPDPASTGLNIKLHLELRLAMRDYSEAPWIYRDIGDSDPAKAGDILGILTLYQVMLDNCSNLSESNWGEKFRAIAVLQNLEELTINFTDAFSPDGEFLGVKSARNFRRFRHGLPPVFKIIAPTEDLKQELYRIFRNNNQ